jgi:uncharacterized protein YigE (DUF2233 family)
MSTGEVRMKRYRVVVVLSAVDAAAQRLDAGAHAQDGFTAIEAAPENKRLRLFWTGDVPGPAWTAAT